MHEAHASVYRPVGIEPDLCIVNTCTVTGKAEQKARRLIRMLLRAYPRATILVTGCYAEVEEPAIRSIDPRVVVFPGSRKGALADLPRFILENSIRAAGDQGTAIAAHARARRTETRDGRRSICARFVGGCA